jgi:hypothetical protein
MDKHNKKSENSNTKVLGRKASIKLIKFGLENSIKNVIYTVYVWITVSLAD